MNFNLCNYWLITLAETETTLAGENTPSKDMTAKNKTTAKTATLQTEP